MQGVPRARPGQASARDLLAIGAALIALTALGLLLLWWDGIPLPHESRARLFVATECLAGLLWLRAVVLVRRAMVPPRTLWIVLGVAAAMRVLAFLPPPLLSSDVYRYVWDGRVQHAGINPYRYLPDAPQLAYLRDSVVYPLVNRADYAHTIYPPAAQMAFAAASFVAPGLDGMKAMMTGFDVLAIIALLRLLRLARRDPAQVLIYAWLPLPVWEFVNNGHIDAVAAGLLTVALWVAAYRKSALTGLLLAAAALTKFLPGVVFPAFWRWRDWRLLAAFVLGLAAFYAPYIGVGWHVLGFLGGYAREEHISHGGGIFLLQVLDMAVTLPSWSVAAYVAVVLGILAVLATRFLLTPLPVDPGERVVTLARHAAVLGAVLLVALSPHYPWYLGWLAPLACLAPLASVAWLLAASPLLALGPIQHLLIPVALYGPATVLAVRDYRNAPSRILL